MPETNLFRDESWKPPVEGVLAFMRESALAAKEAERAAAQADREACTFTDEFGNTVFDSHKHFYMTAARKYGSWVNIEPPIHSRFIILSSSPPPSDGAIQALAAAMQQQQADRLSAIENQPSDINNY